MLTVTAMLLVLLMLISITSASASSDGEAQKKIRNVRLGYFSFQNYMLGAEENGVKSGFVYDLLCDVAAINNWRYEFVYGDFNDLYEELLNGEIDILPCLVYTEERAQMHLFSDEEIYSEEYFISVLNEKVDEISGIGDLNGRTISSVKDCYQNEVFEKWATDNGISMELMCTASFDDSWKQVKEGATDFILNIDSAAQNSGYTSLFEVGEGSSRFAIAPGREDILKELNTAINTIYEINPFAVTHLKEKYLSGTLSSYKLSDEEQKWLSGKNEITIAGFRKDMPYTYSDSTGNVCGVYPDIVATMFEKLGIRTEVKWKLFDSEAEMYRALSEKTVDLICPFYCGYYYAQSQDVIISQKILDVNMALLCNEKTRETEIRKIAVPASALDTCYVTDNYPGAEIIQCGTVADCIDAVDSGRADAAVAHVTALQEDTAKRMMNYTLKLLVAGCPICFSADPENGLLLCIVNRGLHLISNSELQAMEIRHSPENDYAIWNYIKHNKLLVGMFLLALIMIIAYAAERNAASRKLKKNLEEITRQKEIIEANETELMAAKEAANAASKAKSTFLFNMSHDIRTPMNAILGYSDRMLRHIDERDIVKDSAGKIRSSGEYLLSLINDVLDMARIESDKVKLEESINDIREKACVLCDIFEVNMQKKDLKFNTDFSGIKDPVVWYDSLKLRQVLLNLISNAIKYTPDGGTITHTIRQLQSDKQGYGRFEIVVADTGIGMSEEFIEHIFEQFSRSDDSITKETQGTGLGMSIVGKLIDLMGGTIDIQSEPGKGTVITVLMDFRIANEDELLQYEKAKKPAAEEYKLEGLRVLLVDDNELNREIAQDILEEEGCIIAGTAENGEIAFHKAQNAVPGEYDLILMDVQMPIMDGYESTRRIRALENKELAGIPIIAMTANAFEEDRQNSLLAGMNAHITKPVDIDQLRKTLAQFR